MNPELTRRLVASDPKGIAENLLAYLMEVLKAPGGAVLAWQRGRLLAFVSHQADLDPLGDARRAWDRGLVQLEQGVSITCGKSSSLHPLLLGGVLVGAVLLDGVIGADLGEVAIPLAAAVAAPPTPQRGLEQTLEDLTPEELQREQLLVLLKRNEWNIARVARLMACTRRTVYMRLERWGIQRQKVQKGPLRRGRTDPSMA